jgi:HPt (histidine-containing phosphotransfer) domain-containing protein
MIQSNSSLPVIDWNHGKLLSSKAAGLMEDLLRLFLQQLPGFQKQINQAYAEKDFAELIEQLHKLQGSCTYCGLTRLADFIAKSSQVLKQHIAPEQSWLTMFNAEITAIETELKSKGT